jgi:membrane-associated phospholipid phosphatase
MARVLKEAPPGWWPVDWLIAGYFAAEALLIAAFFPRIPDAGLLVAAHAAGIALIAWAARARPKPGTLAGRLHLLFRHWYPLPYVASGYKVIAVLIPPIRGVQYDQAMARWDLAVWGVHPTVWLERFSAPWLTEVLQIAYGLFVPAVLLVAFWLWKQGRHDKFRYYAFLIALGFLASYVGYFITPVRGPRFLLAGEQASSLQGLWLFGWLRQTLDQLESAHYDCFPSGHVELTLLAWWRSRTISTKLFRIYAVYSVVVAFSTVYLRYHYTVDVMAGAVLAAVLLAAGPYLYREQRNSG